MNRVEYLKALEVVRDYEAKQREKKRQKVKEIEKKYGAILIHKTRFHNLEYIIDYEATNNFLKDFNVENTPYYLVHKRNIQRR